ncbi:Fibrous sheath-interacting protein 2 [Sciurus carolinensis]|uniref:Fibrous sheath-interacting protein 2 n=1 Tax=Sciurus carolinensis TaxID=30640 RepID=A0AA41T7A9_SCICA|nr:Fibrous sheath-interacting protein 2 [Sciurus carolinensis]
MELYLNNCSKTAKAAATKVAASTLKAEKTCGTLYQPSFGFNLNDPYCRLLEPSYKSLHDPHLKTYYKRKDILKRLRKGGYITSNNKKIIEKQVNELQENKKVYDNCDATHFQQWLLQESLRTTPDQDLLIKRRYLHMISRELDKIENATERRSALRMREEERRHQEHLRRRLNLHRQIEEEWKSKEMLLLTKIREEVKREAKVEEQHRKVREEIDQKNQALLEKKITYHLQKGQRNEYKISESEENILENKRQDEAARISTLSGPCLYHTGAKNSLRKEHFREKLAVPDHKKPKVKSAVVLAPVFSDKATSISRQSILDSSKQEVTSEELNTIIHNIMTWVVAAVTSILYPVVTNYEERVKNNTPLKSSGSSLSSGSSRCCSTCSEILVNEPIKTFEAEPCAKVPDSSMEQPPTPSKSSSVDTETIFVEKSHQNKLFVTPESNYDETTPRGHPFDHPKVKACESNSHLLVPSEADTKKPKDAATKTDDLEYPLSSDRTAKAVNEMQELKDIFVNFKCYLKEETELTLENIFQEMMSDLTQAIPTLASSTAEVFVSHTDADKKKLFSNVNISSAASEIVENVLGKLQQAIEKKCSEVFSQEDVSVHFKSDLTVSGEYFISPKETPSSNSLPCTLEDMGDVAEDLVHVILGKLKALASSKQNEFVHLQVTPKYAYEQHTKDPTCSLLQRKISRERKSSTEPDAAILQNLVSNILSQSSLFGHIEEAISTILGYVQIGLNNERLIATEETVFTLELLDDIMTQLHQNSRKRDVQISTCSRLSRLSGPEEENRLAGTRVADGPRYGQLLPPINVPGMVLYSEDENEEINKIVENVLISSIKGEKVKSPEQFPDHWSKRGNSGLEYKRNIDLSTRSACPSKEASQDWRSTTDIPVFNNTDFLKDKPCLSKDIWIFSQDEKQKIEKVSENVIISTLTEVFKNIPSVSLGYLANKNGQEASLLISGKPQGLSHQEWMGQLFSTGEIHIVAQELAGAVLEILCMGSSHITSASKHPVSSSVHQSSVYNANVPNEEPLEIWLESKKKMKFLSALGKDSTMNSQLEPEESTSTSESIVHINDKITHTIFKKLKSFISPKLQICCKPGSHATPGKKCFFQPLLSTYTTKVVKIVLDGIQKGLKCNKKNRNLRVRGLPQNFKDTEFPVNAEKELDFAVMKLNNDIMTSSLVTCICEVLSGMTDESNTPLPSRELRSKISFGTADVDQQTFSPFGWLPTQKEVHESAGLQILDRIGDTLYDLLCKLTGDQLHPLSSDNESNREWIDEHLRMTTALQPDVQHISQSILEDIIMKLCSTEKNSSYIYSEFKDISKYIDTDSLSFASLIEEMSRCSDIISSLMSGVNRQDSQEVTASNRKTTVLRTGSAKERYSDKPKIRTLDILESVFVKLEEFVNRHFKILGSIINEKSNKMDLESESANMGASTHEELLHSTLHMHTNKISSAILKAIQAELNMSLPNLETCVHNPLQEKQMLKKLVNLILDGMLPDTCDETEPEERDNESYRYRPIYGNFLPGGAGPESYLEDNADPEKESAGEQRPLESEAKSDSFEQQELERILKKIEVELKEPQKSPAVPIVRNILNEIFRDDLIDQLSALSLPQSHLCGILRAGDEPLTQTSVRVLGKKMAHLVSEADVTIVADGIIRIIFQKLYSVTVTDRSAHENRYNTITIPSNVSFHEHTKGGKSPAFSTILDRNPCTLQTRFSIGKLTRVNVVEDIIQSVLTNLESFVTSKVKSLFYPQINFTIPMTLQKDATTSSQSYLSNENSCSDDQASCCSVDHNKPQKTTSICQLTGSQLNIYATQLTRHILQGIKHMLDKEVKNPVLTRNVVSESITSQIVNTTLEIISTKGKHLENTAGKKTDPSQPENVVEKLFKKSDYQRKLQYQILDTIESILSDICEKTLEENNLPYAMSSVRYNVGGMYLETNSGTVTKYANKDIQMNLVPKSCVSMISNDMVDIVLKNLSSAMMLGIQAKDSVSARSSLTLCGAFPKAECQQSLVMDPTHERKKQRFPSSRRDTPLKSASFGDNQTTIHKKQSTKPPAPDPCEADAHFITKTIFNRLKLFVTERIQSLLTLNSQNGEKSLVSPEITVCKQNDKVFLESKQMPLDINILNVSTDKTILSQKAPNYTFDSYGEKHEHTIHISEGSLKEYADIIASTILMLIKSDIDLEIQKTYLYPNNASFQENIIASETINSILKNLNNKLSSKDSSFYSKQNSDLFTQLAVQNETLPGQRKMESNTELSLISKCPNQNQIISEEENLGRILEEIFKNRESGQEKAPSVLCVVKDILKKAYQRVMEDIDHWPPSNELFHCTTDYKFKTIAVRKKPLLSHISSVANDIVECVFGKMFSIVVTSLYENKESKRELEISGSDELPMKPSCFRGLKEAEKRSSSPGRVISQVYSFRVLRSVTSLETTLLEFSPLQVGNELVQMVLQKITNFFWLNLDESSSPKVQSDETLSQSSKTGPKGSPGPGFRKNFKTKSKATSAPKFGTKPQLKPSGVKAKSKTKLGPTEKVPRGNQSKLATGLQHLVSTEDAQNSLVKTKLPTEELKMYARNIVCTILETIANEFQRVKQNRATVNIKALPLDRLMTVSEIVHNILEGLYTTKNNLVNPTKGSQPDKFKLPQKNLTTISPSNPEARFSLENVSSQLEKIFPKEVIFKQMFDIWQTESSDMENEKYKLLVVAETVLNEILIKAKELEQSVSLLNLAPLETSESGYHNFRRASARTEDFQKQINIFSHEIVEILFEKLELCFLNQVLTTESKETQVSKRQVLVRTNNINDASIYNTELKDRMYLGSSHQIAQEIIEGVLNILESFADLQFKHVSTYAFSEIVKTPIENFLAGQQKPSMKKHLPKLQPLNKFLYESKSNTMISQENIQDILRQLYSFHSELLTYTANTVNDMLGIIKNKTDKEKQQVEPSSIHTLEENTVTSQIISTLMEQCTHFYESLIKNHPKEYLLRGTENAYTDNWAKCTNGVEMLTSKSKGLSPRDNPSQIPSLVFYSEEDRRNGGASTKPPMFVRYSAGDTNKTDAMKKIETELKPSCSRSEAEDLRHFNQVIKGNTHFPKDSVLPKLSQKSGVPERSPLEHTLCFSKMEECENQRMFYSNKIQTTVSQLKIGLAAENIVNSILLSYDLPGSLTHTNEIMQTRKSFLVSKEKASFVISKEQKDEKKSLLKIWRERIGYKTEKENKSLETSRDFTLLEKWKNKSPSLEEITAFKEVEVITFMEQELGPNEIHLIARYVTTSVITHFKNFEATGPQDEKVSNASTLLRKKYESKQPLRSINSDFSLNEFCEHLRKLVIAYILSRISNCNQDSETKQKSLESQNAALNKIILIYSQVFESRSISIRQLALSISEIIIQILLNSDILKVDIRQQMVSQKIKYIYHPRVAVTDFKDVFQNLLIGVIHVLSKEIGINDQSDSKGRNKSFSMLRSCNEAIHNKTESMKRQTGPRVWKSVSVPQMDQLIQKNKLNSLACKLGTLVGSLKSRESKIVVNKIFNIVLDLFLSDKCPNWDMDSGQIAMTMYPSPSNQQSHSTPRQNLMLSPKSAFLLNVVCEKLITMLLKECAPNNSFTNDPLSDEISAECQLFNILQNICSPFEGYDMSNLLENLEEIDQESMVSIISHSLVKSLMEKLSHNVQQPWRSPIFANKHLTYGTRERFSHFPKTKRSELNESRQGKGSARVTSYNKPLMGALNNLREIFPKIPAPLDRHVPRKSSCLPPLRRPGQKAMNVIGIYSATFLEEIISGIFLSFYTSLWAKNVNITETQLNEMNVLGVKSVVNKFNNAQVTVLRDVEEKIYFPLVSKETVSEIVDSVYNDVLWEYELQVACGNNLTHAITSIAEQITNGILMEILDYQLPLYLVENLTPNSYCPLKAENILQKLQNNLTALNYQVQHSPGYTTMLSHSFLEHVIRKLLFQLLPLSFKASCLGNNLMTSDFNEISNCIINKVMLSISKHRIWLSKYDYQHLYMESTLQNMVESIYCNILQMYDSLVSIQKIIASQSPIMVDQMASLIIQEIIENHLQPFLCGEVLPHSKTPLDEISNMVKEVLSEVTQPQRHYKTPPSLGMSFYPNAFVEEVVGKLLSKIFNPNYDTEIELEKMTQKLVNSINKHFSKAKICILREDQKHSFPTIDTDTVDELVNSVYNNVLKQHGLAPEIDNKQLKDSECFADNITNLIVEDISGYLFHPLFSGDLSASSYATLTVQNVIQNIFSGISKSTKPYQHLSPYDTVLPYAFLEDLIKVLLSRIFPSSLGMLSYAETPEDRSEINVNEFSSKLINDIKVKITQHEIRFSKDGEIDSLYSDDEAQHLIDSVFRNILQNSGSSEEIEHNITSGNEVLIDRIAGFIIKNICQQHLHPFMCGHLSPPSTCMYVNDARRQQSFASAYSSVFLEDVICGVLRKIFHRVLGIVQTKSIRNSENELLETAEELIYLISEELSEAQVIILENVKEQLYLPTVDRDVILKITDTVYSKVLQEYELELPPDVDFLSDTIKLSERITKIILAEVVDFQIHPDFVAKLPFKSYSRLNIDVLIKRVHDNITKSRLQKQTSTTYTTILSHANLEKIITGVLSQISPLDFSAEDPELFQMDLNNTIIGLIDKIRSIISKHAICITKHGCEKHMVSEKDIQAMVDAIYTDISHSNLYSSLTKDKKGINNIPVTKIASYIIKEIFNHHLQSFLPEDKTLPSGTLDQTYKYEAREPKQKKLAFIMNSAAFLEEVISEVLCKILYVFSHNILATANITDIVTALVRSIVSEFNASEILVVDKLDENLYLSEEYKEMVQKTVNLIYEKILDEYKSLIHVYRAINCNVIDFGRQIYCLLLGEIYDYQVEALISGEFTMSSYTSLQEENIIRNVLSIINDDSHILPSCITVLPRSLLEDVIYKLLAYIFPSSKTEIELKEEEVSPDYDFVGAASKLTDEIITEISEHEIRLATSEDHAEGIQLEAIENFVDSICNNMKKIKFQADTQKDTSKRGGSFLERIAGFIMKEIVDHHLQPFLCDEESSSNNLPANDYTTELSNPIKGKTSSLPQEAAVYSASFLEDVIIDLVRKFSTLQSITENPKDKEMSEDQLAGMAINFANVLIGEFRKSEVKVLESAEETFSCPPIDKEIVDKVSDSVYEKVMEIYRPNNVQKDDSSKIVAEMIAALAKNAISAFKIQPIFLGDWSSTVFSFLDEDNIIRRVQCLPYKTFTKINRSLKENPIYSPEQPSTSGLKNKMDTSKIYRVVFNVKEDFKNEKTSMKKDSIHEPICTAVTSIMKNKVTTVESELAGGMAYKNKGDKRESSSMKNEKGHDDEIYQYFSPATTDKKNKNVVLGLDFNIDDKNNDEKREGSFKREDVSFELPSQKSKVKEKRRHSPAYKVTDDKPILHPKWVQKNITESIYSNIIETSYFQGPIDYSKFQSCIDDKAAYVTQEDGRDLVQPVLTNSASQDVPVPKEENEKCKDEETKSKLSKPVCPLTPPGKKPGILPANLLEDVISEIVNKLIFSSSPGTDDASQNITNDINKDELYDTAMKLIDSLLKEFSDAQIKILNPDQGNQSISSADKVPSIRKVPLRQKETSVDKVPEIKMIIMEKISSTYKVPPITHMPSSDMETLVAQTPSIDKMLVNKIVHSSVCNILQEYRSQDSICKDINSNSEILAKRLVNAVIEELLQHQVNILLCNEVPASVCLPLESKEFVRKIKKVPQKVYKECQTSCPYTIMLPYEFLESVTSSLLSKIFLNTKPEISDYSSTELNFLQMKLVNTIMTEISKDEHMIVQYVESLHPNDDEIIQLVVQTIYDNLLSQFVSQESIQNCITSGCRMLSETIVNLVVREVAGNQLQTYFSGELTPQQVIEVDSVVENILKSVIQTTKVTQPPQLLAYKLPFNIIEEIAVNFLSKLLFMFPNVDKEPKTYLNDETKKITSKILNSFQEYMSKSQIEVVPQVKESYTISLADSATIEKVVTSVYNTVLKQSGSPTAMYKELISKSNVLSDTIGFLMVKEISNSEFHPQVEEEPSSSGLVLEAVKIMEKVVKIIDNLRSKEKPSSRKNAVLDATILEEMLALFLAKIVKLPSTSSKDAKNLSKPELNRIASHLTKSVMAEITRNNISIIPANPDEQLNPESIEIISQIVDSLYNHILQQCGSREELYYDMKNTNFFPNKVASLIIGKILNCPLEIISSKDVCVNLFGNLDAGRIVERTHECAVKMDPRLEKKESDQDLTQEKLPIKIIPHRRKKPINIDPDIVAEHLGVISIKTQPLEKLQMECLAKTGHTIEALRRASISGIGHSTDSYTATTRRKNARISLDETGRLNIKPLETASRNSFENLLKPDITKVELLKDVQSKKDLIIRLVAHDIDKRGSENKVEEGLTSDEDEVVLQEVVKETFTEELIQGQIEDTKTSASPVTSPKPPVSRRHLKKFLSFSKCHHPNSRTSATSIERLSTQWRESKMTEPKITVSEFKVPTLKSTTDTDSSYWENWTQSSVSEKCY